MRQLATTIAATTILASCWGAPPNEKILTQNCIALMENDPQTVSGLLTMSGTTVDTYCPCYAKSILADPTKIDLHKDVISTIVDTRDANNVGVEDAVELIELMISHGEIDTFTSKQLDSTGDDFQEIAGSFEDGVCPIS